MYRRFEELADPFAPAPLPDAPPTGLWDWFRFQTAPFRGLIAATAAFAALAAFIDVGLVAYSGRVIDLMTQADTAQAALSRHGWELAVAAVLIIVLRPVIFTIQAALINNAFMPNFATSVRWRAHKHVLRQSVGWFENDFAGRISNRMMQTPSAAGEVLYQVFDALTWAAAYVVGTAVVLAGADPRLLIPLALWIVPYFVLLRWVVRRIGPASAASSEARSRLTGRLVDAYTNIQTVKMFDQGERELDHGREAVVEMRETFQREMRIFTTMDFWLSILNAWLMVGVTGWAIWLWAQGTASVGVVAAASALTLRLSAMSGWIMMATSDFFEKLGVVKEGLQTLSHPVTLVDERGARPLVVTEGRIVFEAVTHAYGTTGGNGLRGVDLVIEPGQKVGLVGRSGAGKSTLVKLLLRFYDAEGGRILIDGQDIRHVTQESLRAAIGMVQQDSALMHRSVRDNLLYGRPQATDAQIERAAAQAEAHEFILELADADGRQGYAARVGERGVKLSGGQRQRVALARVILKDAPILVLDEATSALDSEVEAAIQSTLSGMMTGKTVIAIAHRLSTLAQMDRIVVLDAGRVVEDGTHASLLAEGGIYARLWTRQSGGFLDRAPPDEATDAVAPADPPRRPQGREPGLVPVPQDAT